MNAVTYQDRTAGMNRYHKSLYRQGEERRLMVLGCSLSEARTIIGLRAKSRAIRAQARAAKGA